MIFVYYVVCCILCTRTKINELLTHSVMCLTIILREKNIYNHSNL